MIMILMVEAIYHRKKTTYDRKDKQFRLSYEKAGKRH